MVQGMKKTGTSGFTLIEMMVVISITAILVALAIPSMRDMAERNAIAGQTQAWAKDGEVFAYFIAGAKVRNPAAAQALIARLKT